MQNQSKHSKIHSLVLLLILALAGTIVKAQTKVPKVSYVVTGQETTYVVQPVNEIRIQRTQNDDWEFDGDFESDEDLEFGGDFDWDEDWSENYQYDYNFDWTLPEILGEIEFPTAEVNEAIQESLELSRAALRATSRAMREKSRRMRSRMRTVPRPSPQPRQEKYDQEEWQALKELYHTGYNLILKEKWLEALTALREFISKYPSTNYTDDARFWICYAQEHSGTKSTEVFEAYQLFIADFQSSKWADDAKASLITIGRQLVGKNRKQREQYGPIVMQLQRDLDNEVALAALTSLRRSDDESALQAIIGVYDPTGEEEFRKKVVYALGHMEGDAVAVKLAEIARRDPSEDVRELAINRLSHIDSEAAIDGLAAIAKDSPNTDARLRAVRALGRTDSDRVVPILLDMARNDPHIRVRTEAAASLGHLDTAPAREALIQLLERK